MSAYLEFWYAALASPLGVVIETDNFERARAKLYAARREAMDPALDNIAVMQSPTNPSDIWLVKRKQNDPA